MPRKPKMPKNAGIRFDRATGQSWVAYEVTVTINPAEYGVSPGATNREMVEAVLEALRRSAAECARKAVADEIKSLRDDVFTASTEADRLRAAITAAVDALPEWSKGALAHLSPAELVADEVRMALRDALAKVDPPVVG